jgi:hypothetical protein
MREIDAASDANHASAHAAPVFARSMLELVEGCWQAFVHLQNCLEDIAGSDGRIDYLHALRPKVLAEVEAVDAALAGRAAVADQVHGAARAIEHGLPTLRLGGPELCDRLLLNDGDCVAEDLEAALLAVGGLVLKSLPGELPAAQGSSGQREIIRALRLWSNAATERGHDLGFLAERLQDL